MGEVDYLFLVSLQEINDPVWLLHLIYSGHSHLKCTERNAFSSVSDANAFVSVVKADT